MNRSGKTGFFSCKKMWNFYKHQAYTEGHPCVFIVNCLHLNPNKGSTKNIQQVEYFLKLLVVNVVYILPVGFTSDEDPDVIRLAAANGYWVVSNDHFKKHKEANKVSVTFQRDKYTCHLLTRILAK